MKCEHNNCDHAAQVETTLETVGPLTGERRDQETAILCRGCAVKEQMKRKGRDSVRLKFKAV